MKGKKCILYQKLFIIFALLFVPLLISLKNVKPASATAITSLLATQAEFTKNFESNTTIQTFSSVQVPGNVVNVTDSNITGFWYYRQNIVFMNPVQNHSGTGFNHTIYFTLSTDGPYLNDNLSTLLASAQLRFEGVNLQNPYCTSNYDIISMSKTSYQSVIRFKFSSSCPSGTYSSTQNFQNVYASISYRPDSIFWCANDSNRVCPNTGVHLRVGISDIDYSFEVLNSSQDSTNQTIINQNQTIINQNQQQIDQNNQDREDLQNQQGDSESSASSAGSDVNNAGTRLLDVVTTFFGLFISPPQRDCKIRADLGHMDLGTIDLCELSPPPAFSIMASLIMIGATIPFAISVINTLLKLMEGALST